MIDSSKNKCICELNVRTIVRNDIYILNIFFDSSCIYVKNRIRIEYHCFFNDRCRLNAIYFAILVELSVMSLSFGGLLKAENHKLPYRMWLPYNYTSSSAYIFIYTQQVISLIIGAMIHIACDSFIWALLMYICSQIEIFNCRLKKIKHEKNKVTKLCIHYHNLIYRYDVIFLSLFNFSFIPLTGPKYKNLRCLILKISCF